MKAGQYQNRFGKAFAIMAMTISIMGTSGIALATPYVHSEKLVGGAITTTDWNNIGNTLNGIDNSGGAGTSWGFGMTSTGTATIETAGGIIVNAGGADITGVVTANDGVVIDTITLDAATITDTATTGFSYAGDYSTNNAANDRWLVDKGYVDGVITAGAITAGSGITNNTGTFDLGGVVTSNVSLTGADVLVDMVFEDGADSNTYTEFLVRKEYAAVWSYSNVGDVPSGYSKTSPAEVIMTSYSGVGSNKMEIQLENAGRMLVTDSINSIGLEYAADYSTNYTNRSLVDKAYVDNATSGSIQLDRPASAAAPVTTTCDELSEVGTLAYTYTASGQNGTNEGKVHVCSEYDNGGTQGYIWLAMTVFGS